MVDSLTKLVDAQKELHGQLDTQAALQREAGQGTGPVVIGGVRFQKLELLVARLWRFDIADNIQSTLINVLSGMALFMRVTVDEHQWRWKRMKDYHYSTYYTTLQTGFWWFLGLWFLVDHTKFSGVSSHCRSESNCPRRISYCATTHHTVQLANQHLRVTLLKHVVWFPGLSQ